MTDHEKRIKQELRAVGVTGYGLLKGESRKLPAIVHPQEHIHGAIYGRYQTSSAMLVATDRRMIFVDWKPLFTTSDELSYDVVSGVSFGHQGRFASVTLHTRVGDYSFNYVNVKCARQFIAYIEAHRLERPGDEPAVKKAEPVPPVFGSQATTFLQTHETGVLSSIDRTGNVHGAVVYYRTTPSGFIYILTKAETQKAHNIFAHTQVAFTIYDEPHLQTLQLQGLAMVEAEPNTKQYIFNEIVKPRDYNGQKRLPPVSQLHEGAYMVIKITPVSAKFNDYKAEPL